MQQRALKRKADARGLLLRPQDSNAVGGGGIGAIRKNGKSSAILGAGGGGKGAGRAGGDDPLAKKVKVRLLPCMGAWHGMTWRGVARRGVAWHGVAWPCPSICIRG